MEAATVISRQHLADDPQWREAQRERLHELEQDLLNEGAAPAKYLSEIESRAAAWSE
jgi:hypothetical protein